MKELYEKLVHGEELTLEEAFEIGDTSEIEEKLPIKYIIGGDIYLGSEVYKTSKTIAPVITPEMNLVAKLNLSAFLKFEHSKNQEAQKRDIPIIKSKEVVNIYNYAERQFSQGLILERFSWKTISELEKENSIHYQQAYKIWKKTLEETKKKGVIFNGEDHNENAMFDPKTKKVILLDSIGWDFC